MFHLLLCDYVFVVHFIACYYNKSYEIIKYIYDSYPQAISKTDDSTRLPLFYAVIQCHSYHIIEYLLERYPISVQSYDKYKRLPLHYFIARNSLTIENNPMKLKILRLLLELYPYAVSMNGHDNINSYELAKREGLSDALLVLLLDCEPTLDIELYNKYLLQEKLKRDEINKALYLDKNNINKLVERDNEDDYSYEDNDNNDDDIDNPDDEEITLDADLQQVTDDQDFINDIDLDNNQQLNHHNKILNADQEEDDQYDV